MKPTVYIETTIVSYLTAKPSRDVIVAAHQKITAEWWQKRRKDFELVISQEVLDEAAAGNATYAQKRLELLKLARVLEIDDQARALTKDILRAVSIPPKAQRDAVHIAVSAVNGTTYLLTWNCRHIANTEIQPKLKQVCEKHGFKCPLISTPDALMGKFAYEE